MGYYWLLWPSLLSASTSILQLVCPPSLRAFPMRFLLGLIYIHSHYQHPRCVEAKSPKTLAGKWGPEDALSSLLSTPGRWPGTRFLPTETLSSLVFFSFFITLSKLKRELAGIQKKPGKRSLLQRRCLSKTHGLSDPWGTVSKHPAQMDSFGTNVNHYPDTRPRHSQMSEQPSQCTPQIQGIRGKCWPKEETEGSLTKWNEYTTQTEIRSGRKAKLQCQKQTHKQGCHLF